MSINEQEYTLIRPDGKRIVCILNEHDHDQAPIVIVTPQYEGTIRTNSMMMLFLYMNGYSILRFDFCDSEGLSEGKFFNFTMSSALLDLETVVNHLLKTRNKQCIVPVVGNSISARILYRMLSTKNYEQLNFISVFGILDMTRALYESTNGNVVVAEMIKNTAHHFIDYRIVRKKINMNNFVSDILKNSFHSFEITVEEISKISNDIYLIAGEKDTWAPMYQNIKAFKNNQKSLKKIVKIANAGHELYKNPSSARRSFRSVIEILDSIYRKSRTEILEPDFTLVISRDSHERKREQRYREMPAAECS